MKRKHLLNSLLFTAVTLIGYVSFTSYSGGPGLAGGLDRTGAKGNTTTCGGVTCHGGTSANTTVTITVDTATTTTAVNSYRAGKAYTIKIHGTNTSGNPNFGFQYAVVSGTGFTQVQAGNCSNLPTNVQMTTVSSINVIEHAATMTATSAGVYDVSFTWVAPAAGTGTVTMYCTLNAVDGTSGANAADVSNNVSKTLTEQTSSSVDEITSNIEISAYPNPVMNSLQVKMGNATTGTYTLNVFDMSGRKVMSQNVEVTNSNFETAMNTSTWATGMYGLQIIKDGVQRMIPIVKQ